VHYTVGIGSATGIVVRTCRKIPQFVKVVFVICRVLQILVVGQRDSRSVVSWSLYPLPQLSDIQGLAYTGLMPTDFQRLLRHVSLICCQVKRRIHFPELEHNVDAIIVTLIHCWIIVAKVLIP
jgi:hypothetical protein